jgi:hypothetical protein
MAGKNVMDVLVRFCFAASLETWHGGGNVHGPSAAALSPSATFLHSPTGCWLGHRVLQRLFRSPSGIPRVPIRPVHDAATCACVRVCVEM